MRVVVGVATDIGRVRERNEDSYLVEPPLYAVADGMGGARGGAVASSLALDKMEELFRGGKGPLGELIRSANRAVFERSISDRNVSGMGTTLTAATVDDLGAHLGHVGDSRAYLLRAGSLRQLTEDHTLVNRMVKAGELTPQEAGTHPHRNVLTRSVGTEPEVEVDEEDVPLIDGDRLLICSDGLTGMVTEPQIQAILEATPNPQDAADRLVKTANRAGGIDNITVVILDIHEGDEGGPDVDRRKGAGASRSADPEERSREAASTAIVGAQRRRRPSAANFKKWAVRAGVVVLAALAVFFALRIYLDRQWYVGEADGHVAVYQGIPARFGGLRFSHVEVETDIPASEVAQLPQYPALSDGITANDRTEAERIVEQIRRDLTAAAVSP
jgi:serine/threonine protein phosphatase PrpC